MARQDRPYFKIQHEFFFGDPRFLKLTLGQRMTFLALWALAVEQRCTTLRPEIDARYIADRCKIDIRSVRHSLQKCSTIGGKNALIHINDDGSITVNGVRSVHNSLKNWNDPVWVKQSDLNLTQSAHITEQNRTEQNSTPYSPPVSKLETLHGIDLHNAILKLLTDLSQSDIGTRTLTSGLFGLWQHHHRELLNRDYIPQKWDKKILTDIFDTTDCNYKHIADSITEYWTVKSNPRHQGDDSNTVEEWQKHASGNFEKIRAPHKVYKL